MRVRTILPHEQRRMPWKNGGGTTAEIAVGGEDAQGFDWRLSVADVERDGPFSSFPGCDRVLTVLEGAGMALTVAGARHVLEPLAPFAFAGDVPTEGALLAGPIRDLNLIFRRDRHRAAAQVLRAPASQPLAGPAFVFAARGEAEVRVGDAPALRLGPGATLVVDGAPRGTPLAVIPGPGAACVLLPLT